MKASPHFKTTIQNHLDGLAAKDELFAETLKKPKKNIDDCITYILNQVKELGYNGFEDDEIFGMAVHYYDEDDIKVGKPISGNIVVNHKVELTAEDKEVAKQKAIDLEVEAERKKLKLKHKVKLTDEDIAEVKKEAIAKLVDEQKEKLVKKKPIKPKSKDEDIVEPVVQASLFD